MNLRDLIYSQSQSSQRPAQAVDEPEPLRHNFSSSQTPQQPTLQQYSQGPADPQYDIAALFHRTNENQNGLFRRFIKKHTSIRSYTDSKLAEVENWANQLPRRILSYRTAQESFDDELSNILNS